MPGTGATPTGARPSLGRRVVAASTERLALKGAALFFACVLWLVVSAEEPTEQVVEVLVVPRLDSTTALVGRRPVVRALVVGRARDLLELAGDPPVARPVVTGATADSARVTILPGDVELPTNANVIVREVRPRMVTLQLARVARPVPPATPAESALAGLAPPRVRADTAAVGDSIALDTLAPLDTVDSAALVPPPIPAADSSRRGRGRRDSLARPAVPPRRP